MKAMFCIRIGSKWQRVFPLLLIVVGVWVGCGKTPKTNRPKVPGVVVDHSAASTGRYIGSPSIAILPNKDYVASHDYFGPRAGHCKAATTALFSSSDQGNTWHRIATIKPLFWGKLFVHRGDLYTLGITHQYGDIVIRRSRDGGKTWTEPIDSKTGRLTEGAHYHRAPCPLLVHDGRIWFAVEQKGDVKKPWGDFITMVVSTPEGADLLDASNWTFSDAIKPRKEWLDRQFRAWLEGNVVRTPQGRVVNILRVNTLKDNTTARGQAAVVHVSDNAVGTSFDPNKDIIDFPGGAKKFAIQYDPVSKRYWSLVNYVRPEDVGKANAGSIRNTLALTSSPDLENWTIHSIILHHPDAEKVGFQYVDWAFGGNDLIAVSRTAYDDGHKGSRRAHDANYLTFHRIKDFRDKQSQILESQK